jgi:hypothetical protein
MVSWMKKYCTGQLQLKKQPISLILNLVIVFLVFGVVAFTLPNEQKK